MLVQLQQRNRKTKEREFIGQREVPEANDKEWRGWIRDLQDRFPLPGEDWEWLLCEESSRLFFLQVVSGLDPQSAED